MPDNKEISALTTAEQTSNNDLFETSIPNAMTDTGYISRKQSVTMLEQQMLGNTQYNTELPNFTVGNRTIFKALEEARSSGGGGASVIQKTMAEYTALPSADKMNGSIYKITDKALIYCLDEEYHAVLEITSADYAQLTSAEKNNGTLYVLTDEETTAADISYTSGVSVADKLDNVPTFDTLTTGDNNKLLGVSVSGDDISVGAVDNGCSFSESEMLVGEWINGKPLYKKVIKRLSKTIPSGSITESLSSLGATMAFFDHCIMKDNYGNYVALPYISSTANTEISCYISANFSTLYITHGSYWENKTCDFYITILYTKT